jgi:ABC-type multidrug transport system fused ATPase/permease subunit
VTVVSKVLDLLSARARGRLVLLLMLLLAAAALEALGIASILPFMALVINPESIQQNHWLSVMYERLEMRDTRQFLTWVGTLVLVLLVVTNFCKMASTWFMLRYMNWRAYELARRLLVNYLTRPYSYYLTRNTSELGGSVLFEAPGVIDRVLRPILEMVAAGMTCLAITVVLLVTKPLAAVLIVSVVGGSYALVYMLVHRRLDRYGEQQVESNTERIRSASEAMVGIKDIKILGRETAFLDRFAFYTMRSSSNAAISGAIGQLPRFVLEIVAFGGLLLAVLYFVSRGNESAQVVPVLALYAFAGYRLMPTLQALFNSIVVIRYNIASLDRVHGALADSVPSAEAEQELRSGEVATPAQFNGALELRDVTFQYEGAMEPSLRGLAFTVQANTTIGLVGPTGCGKSTTVDVILGLLEPQQGTIVLDGVEITDANRRNWQRAIGYVPQHIFISDDTVARNIAFGIPDEEIDMTAVRKAAQVANLAEFIDNELPEGYHTNIGERGARLSGGQRQRIGIARAMYRDPAVLVLDEATSALDGVTEEGVMRAVHGLSKRKTIILIAHRLSTVRECDLIYQLDHGAVAASGTYDELMRTSAWFRNAARGSE